MCGVENGYFIRRAKGNGSRYLSEREFNGFSNVKGWGKTVHIILTIAHLDHDIKNNDNSNLMALCQFHHLRHDKRDNLEKKARKKQEQIEKHIKEFDEMLLRIKRERNE